MSSANAECVCRHMIAEHEPDWLRRCTKITNVDGVDRLCHCLQAIPRVMRALSLWQPWASMLVRGDKTVETRWWSTRYRGPILVCAAKRFDDENAHRDPRPQATYPLGMALGYVELYNVRYMQPGDAPHACIDYEPARYSWLTRNAVTLRDPFRVKGQQGLWSVDVSDLIQLAAIDDR